MSEPWQLPARSLLAALVAGRLSGTELVRALLARMDALDPAINAVVARRDEAALEEAAILDRERAAGRLRGPLHGLPMTVKDSIEVAGLPATCGARSLADHRPLDDAESVRRLRSAGAVILGKTNVPAWAADLDTFNELHGRTANPWAPERSPGGSSGGAAAALAAGLTPLELGSDLSGSLRLPAHYCGVCSLKPSPGLVPLAGSLSGPPGRLQPADAWTLGPMARTAGDLALLFGVLAGADEADTVAWQLSLPPPPDRPLRVALWLEEGFCPPDTAIADALEAAARAWAAGGSAVLTTARPALDGEEIFGLHCRLMWAEMAWSLPEENFDYFVRRAGSRRRAPGDVDGPDALAAGLTLRHREWLHLREQRREVMRVWQDFFGDYDLALCPAAPTVAPLHDPRRLEQRTASIGGHEVPTLRSSFWAALANLPGLPSLTLPVGMDPATGLPIGAQLIGPRYADRTLLAAAAGLEAITGGFRPPPESPPAL